MIKTRIAFYHDLAKQRETLKKCQLDDGNPGIGGTQYMFVLTVKYINQIYGRGYAVLLTDDDISLNDLEIPQISVGTAEKASCYCESQKINTLVINANVADRVPSHFWSTDISIILWGHNTLNAKRQKVAAKYKSIKRVVCVSKSQYENMRDSVCFPKCTYIDNALPTSFFKNAMISDYSTQSVIYVGSVFPQKGVHNLLKIWRYVQEKAPEAKLYIVGGAKVWNPEIQFGSLGISDIFYDRFLMKKLKKIKDSAKVYFCGAMGWNEINDLVKYSRVGVVNPSHYMRDETFCMSAIELQAHGLPVVSRKRNDGLKSTIINEHNGYLAKTDRQIAEKIILLLKDKKYCETMGKQAIDDAQRFQIHTVVNKWVDIVQDNPYFECEKKYIPSKDSLWLFHDFILKLIYMVASGKMFSKIFKRK